MRGGARVSDQECALGKDGGASVLEAGLPGVELFRAFCVRSRSRATCIEFSSLAISEVCISRLCQAVYTFCSSAAALIYCDSDETLPHRSEDFLPRQGPSRSLALTTPLSRNRLSYLGRHLVWRLKTPPTLRSTSKRRTSRRYRTTSSACQFALPTLRTSRPSSIINHLIPIRSSRALALPSRAWGSSPEDL
ncbi:hypothetical protein BC628DRAFT_880061 [Trametes gibbosa]|nr:hypothetical protein BC628DRAFT_880061 [Trametes gibbosa]